MTTLGKITRHCEFGPESRRGGIHHNVLRVASHQLARVHKQSRQRSNFKSKPQADATSYKEEVGESRKKSSRP